MANNDPHQARAAKKRNAVVRKAGTPEQLQALVWKAITVASGLVGDAANDPATRLKAVHALTQAAGAYVKLTAATDFEARLLAIEEAREEEHEL